MNDRNYKSFRDQSIECKKNGNQIEVDVSLLKLKMMPGLLSGVKEWIETDSVIVCLKHKSVCHSLACAAERGIEIKGSEHE
jgi:hypothetical protein